VEADILHGVPILAFVALLPAILRLVLTAALAGALVATGWRQQDQTGNGSPRKCGSSAGSLPHVHPQLGRDDVKLLGTVLVCFGPVPTYDAEGVVARTSARLSWPFPGAV